MMFGERFNKQMGEMSTSLSPLRYARRPSGGPPCLTQCTLRLVLLPRCRLPRLFCGTAFKPSLVNLLAIHALRRYLLHFHRILHSTRNALMTLRLRLLHIPCWIARLQCGLRLLFARRIKVGGHALPPVVGSGSELLHHGLPADIELLFLDGGWFWAGVAKPLVPLRCAIPSTIRASSVRMVRVRTCDLHIRVMRPRGVPHNPPPSIRLQCILEHPERVTSQVSANEELFAPWQV